MKMNHLPAKKNKPNSKPISIQKSWPKAWIADKMHKFIIDKL